MKSFKPRPLTIYLIAGGTLILSLLIAAWVLPRAFKDKQVEAPETERVLQSQRKLPFQILIPAYLPEGFERESVEIQTGQTGPDGQEMVQLVYRHPLGVTLTLTEWLRSEPALAEIENILATTIQMCHCQCQDANVCSDDQLMVDNGPVHIMGKTSDHQILSPEHVKVILSTLGPASGLLTYSELEDVSIAAGLPPAEEIPLNDSGVQEVVLVVTPGGYTPVHFSVKKNVPVRLVFRQLGDVGCGNELYVQWGPQQTDYLSLANPGDTQVLEFTPGAAGEFPLHCSHYIFQGVMTVVE